MEGRFDKGSEFPEFPHCFVCGQSNPNGLRTCFFPDGQQGVKAIFTPDKSHVGYEDAVHGGILSALLDEAIIWATYASTGRFGVTAELLVRFLRPLTVGKTCTVLGRMKEDKGKLWIAESEIIDDAGNVLVKAEGKVIPIKQELKER